MPLAEKPHGQLLSANAVLQARSMLLLCAGVFIHLITYGILKKLGTAAFLQRCLKVFCSRDSGAGAA
jgi:hypothetical protein